MNTKYNTPIVDICCIVGVESLFHHGTKDPCANKLAANFADFFIWNDNVRFILPSKPDILKQHGIIGVPSLINKLISRDSGSLRPEICRLAQDRTLEEGKLLSLFKQFSKWAFIRKNYLKSWINLHNESWIKKYHDERIKGRYVYNVDTLISSPEFFNETIVLDISSENLCYLFDLSLRYQLYGEFVGKGEYYLSHPIREEQDFSNVKKIKVHQPQIPIGLGKYLMEFAKDGDIDTFTVALHEARGIVRELKLLGLPTSEIDREILRELASKLRLPPRLKKYEEIKKILRIFPIISNGVALIDSIWKGNLPRNFARIEWLHWAFDWEIEKESYENKKNI